jgi:hypothetical protein
VAKEMQIASQHSMEEDHSAFDTGLCARKMLRMVPGLSNGAEKG